jgi:uncharacterized membrane protein
VYVLKKFAKYPILFCTGGTVYVLLEILFRGYSHWTMFILGGLCFLIIGAINEVLGRNTPLFPQMCLGSLVITTLEFLTGCVVNIELGWDVWDYSDMPLNFMGQICLPFSIIWFFVSLLAIVLDDYIRYKLFDYPKPHYRFF